MKNKKGKKLVVLGAMAALLTLIGVSGSQTYAKYVETATVKTQTATVAKWGLVFNADVSKLFSTEHDTTQAETSVKAAGTSIVAAGSNNVVAPGAKGYMTFGVTGTAEVLSEISLALSDVQDVALSKGGAVVYNPLVWTFSYTDSEGNLQEESGTLAHIAEELENHVQVLAAKTNLGDTEYKLSYEWPFEQKDGEDPKLSDVAKASGGFYTYNELDTILGRLTSGDPATNDAIISSDIDTTGFTAQSLVQFTMSITATQIQSS